MGVGLAGEVSDFGRLWVVGYDLRFEPTCLFSADRMQDAVAPGFGQDYADMLMLHEPEPVRLQHYLNLWRRNLVMDSDSDSDETLPWGEEPNM